MNVYYAPTEGGGHDWERWEEDMAAAEADAEAFRQELADDDLGPVDDPEAA